MKKIILYLIKGLFIALLVATLLPNHPNIVHTEDDAPKQKFTVVVPRYNQIKTMPEWEFPTMWVYPDDQGSESVQCVPKLNGELVTQLGNQYYDLPKLQISESNLIYDPNSWSITPVKPTRFVLGVYSTGALQHVECFIYSVLRFDLNGVEGEYDVEYRSDGRISYDGAPNPTFDMDTEEEGPITPPKGKYFVGWAKDPEAKTPDFTAGSDLSTYIADVSQGWIKTLYAIWDDIPRNLIITKTADKETANVGDEITYTITIENKVHYTLEDIEVKDVLGEGLEYVSDDSNGRLDGNEIYWNIDVEQNDQVTIKVVAKVLETSGASVKNTAIATIPDDPYGPIETESETDVETTVEEKQTKEVKRTIHYCYESSDGKKASDDVVQSTTFEKTVKINRITKEVVEDGSWSPESETFKEVTSPTIKGWKASTTNVASQKVTADDVDTDVYVIYTKEDSSSGQSQNTKKQYTPPKTGD